MRRMGSKTFEAYEEFVEKFTTLEKVISYYLKTMVLGHRLRVLNRVVALLTQRSRV